MSSEKQCGIKPLDLSRWRNLPTLLMAGGGAVALIGLLISWKLDGGKQFAFSWLLAFMFCLSICLGSLFLVIVHHLFDAGWSVRADSRPRPCATGFPGRLARSDGSRR